MLRTKFTRDIKVVDLEGGRVNAVVSTEETDRMGDIVRVEGWDFDNFMKHPVLLASHNYYSMQAQIGEWEDMRVKGKKVVGTAKYYIGQGNDDADWGFKLAQKGMAAYSVGFNPDMDKAEVIDDETVFPTYEFKGQELLEVSHVTIPANASALQQMKAMALDPVVAAVVDEAIGHFDNDLRDLTTTTSHAIDEGTIHRLHPRTHSPPLRRRARPRCRRGDACAGAAV